VRAMGGGFPFVVYRLKGKKKNGGFSAVRFYFVLFVKQGE
jgi:hypothetical protein